MPDPIALGAKLAVMPPPDAAVADADLVAALARKDAAAAATLWERFSPQVRRVIRRSVGVDEVEDLVQDVFLRLFDRIHTLRDPGALQGFVLTVTTSIIISDLRRKKVRRFLWLTREGELPERATAPVNDEAREALKRLYRVLDGCGNEERMAFMLTQVEGLELAQVAEALGISVATVKRRLTKMQARLRKAVADDALVAAALGLHGDSKGATRQGSSVGADSTAEDRTGRHGRT